jgi:hypothetical protein
VRGTHFLESAEKQVSTVKESEAEEHSHPGERRKKDGSGREKRRVRGTHKLDGVERGTSQDMETTRASESHSLPGERRGRNKSLHKKKVGGRRRALTN